MDDVIPYLMEIRQRLLRCVWVVGLVFAVLAFEANHVYHLIALPLLKHLPIGDGLIAISIPGPFIVPLKSAFVASIYLTAPFWLYQLWAFIAPALYRHERSLVWLLLLTSVLLFYLGTLFAYFLVMPLVFKFLVNVAPLGVSIKPDISHYLSFVMHMFFAFGVAFELPVAMWLLISLRIVSYATLANKRPYVIVAAFVVGMLLTPPDVVSQALLAIPLCLLYELGLWLAKIFILPQTSRSQG